MKTLKKILLIVLLAVSQMVIAQPMFQFSQYMFNDYALNPAIGGTHDYWQIKSNYRYQWAGIPDGPQTYMLGAYGPHKTMPMGYGGYIFNDVVGAVSYLGMYGSYAYNVRISGDIRLSMGLSLGRSDSYRKWFKSCQVYARWDAGILFVHFAVFLWLINKSLNVQQCIVVKRLQW